MHVFPGVMCPSFVPGMKADCNLSHERQNPDVDYFYCDRLVVGFTLNQFDSTADRTLIP